LTSTSALAPLSDIVADLSRDLPPEARLQRLLEALMESFPCDAAVLLQLEEDHLVPRAVKGLNHEAMGRRFAVADQPRLQRILHSRGPIRFAADSDLPDPYDGLVDAPGGDIDVHDCLGAPLHLDGEVWGVLTLDAMAVGAFASLDQQLFETFVSVATASIRAAAVIQSLETELERQQWVSAAGQQGSNALEMVGSSPPMEKLYRETHVVARADVSVLIQGETGVGKELVARLIHRQSLRAHQPMIQVNCAALPESLAESELFGHERGAFSGADQARAGKFELADGGSLLLDEVGELPLAIQAKLLRVLQSGEIQRVGSDRAHHCDVRIIAATNRNLEEEVANGNFRADLYHRLNVYPLTVPPLRQRREDIPLLAGHFMQQCERRLGLRRVRLTPAARRWMQDYHWPGNVRELDHAITRGVVKRLSEHGGRPRIVELAPRHLGADPPAHAPEPPATQPAPVAVESDLSLAEAVDQFKREFILHRLARHDDNLSATARSLGIDRGNFHRQLKRLGLR